MAYRIEKCKCGDNDWDLIAQRFQCKSCENKTVVHKFEEGVDNPLNSVYIRRESKDGSKDEAKAHEMEKDKMRDIFRKPPNCS
jgi:hypothetical protein